jgi:hypothetical protein
MLNAFVLLLTLLPAYINADNNKRLLLIFTDKIGNTALKQQQALLNADLKGLKERDVEIRTYYKNSDVKLFKAYHITSGFTAILVGKDGGEKIRSSRPLTLEKLFNTIDAMPMRRHEMQKAANVDVL